LLLLVGIPLVVLLISWAQPQPETWEHLSEYLLPRLIGHTALMMVVVGLGVLVLGVSLAWLSACCEYPLPRVLDPMLVLPLAFPTSVLAFIYLGMLDYAGPVQTLWRHGFGAAPAPMELLSRPVGVLFIL